MPSRPPRLRPLLLALAALPAAACGVELGVRAYDSRVGGALSRPPCPDARTAPCPLARHALRPHSSFVLNGPDGGTSAVTINSLGFRGPEPAVPKPAGTVRVLILGDEAALAAGLPADGTFAGLLEPTVAGLAAARGGRGEVLNAAVPGDCPLLSVLRLRALAGLDPDLILLCVRPSDLAEDARYRRDLLTDDAGRPVACPHPAFTKPGGCELNLPWWRQSLTVRLLTRRAACLAPAAAAADGPDDLAAELALSPLEELARVAAARGCPAVAVILPESPEGRFADDAPAAARIIAAAEAAGLTVYDGVAAFAAAGTEPADLMTPAGRLTPAGHAELARGLAALLTGGPAAPTGPPPTPETRTREPRPAAL